MLGLKYTADVDRFRSGVFSRYLIGVILLLIFNSAESSTVEFKLFN